MKAVITCFALLFATVAAAWEAPAFDPIKQAERDRARNQAVAASLEATRLLLVNTKREVGSDNRRNNELLQQQNTLTKQIEQRQQRLAEQREQVRELNINARQAAGDLVSLLRESVTAEADTELPTRLQKLAGTSRPLNLDALAMLWESLHQSLTFSATQSVDEQPVQVAPLEMQSRQVIRVGNRLALTADGPARFDPVTLSYYPIKYGPATVKPFVTAGLVMAPFSFGPTPPTDSLSVQSLIADAGPIGALIIMLGGGGLVLLVIRSVLLWRTLRAEKSQAADSPGAVLRQQCSVHDSESEDSIAAWVNAAVRREARRLLWGHTGLSFIIAAAPLLGLLGTVTGMIVLFNTIRVYGGGDPVLMAEGIAAALSTTLLGLTVAIPLLLGQRSLLAVSNRIIGRLDQLALALMAQVRACD